MPAATKPAIFILTDKGKPAPLPMHRRRHLLTLGLLALAAFALGFFPAQRAYLWDEAVYLASAENLVSDAPYYSELDFRPPLLSVLLYLGSQVMSIELFARLLTAAFFVAGVLLLYLTGSRVFGYLEGLAAAVLMLVSPFFLFWAHKVMADIPATVLALASVYFLFVHVEERGEEAWSALLAGLLLAASVLTRWVCGLAGICALYFLVTRRFRLRSGLWYAAGFIAGMAPYLIWAQLTLGSMLKPFRTAFVIVELGSEAVTSKLYYVEAAYQVAGPLAVFGLVCYLYLLWRDRSGWIAKELPIILWFTVFLVYLNLVSHKEARYILPAIPALFLLAGRGFSSLRDQKMAGLMTLVVPVAALYVAANLDYFRGNEPWMRTMLDYSSESRTAGLYVKENLPPSALLYANHLWPVLAYHSKHATVAVWPRDDRFYHSYPKNMAKDGYFIYYRGVEKKPDEEWLSQRLEFRKVKEFRNLVIYSYKNPGDRVVDPDLQKRLEAARVEFGKGSYDTVLEILAPVRIPDVDVGDLRGWSYYRMGKINEASAAFRQGLLAEPSNPRCLTGLGYSELRLGQPELAKSHFQAAVDQIPEKTDALVGLGIANLRLRDKTAAAQALRKALALSPGNEEIREYLKQAEAP